jgi:hypothetical protein
MQLWKRIRRLKWNSEEGSQVTRYEIYSVRRFAGHSVWDILSYQTIPDELLIFIARIRSQNARRISTITLHEWTQAEQFVMLWLTGRWGVRRRTSDRKNVGRLWEGGREGCVAGTDLQVCIDAIAGGEYVAWSAPEFHWNQIQVPQIIIRAVLLETKMQVCIHIALIHDKKSVIKKVHY